jgi:anionic cell wall polymer biosynthesis LytR-Cps2A-Psr (LCP) family protein
VKDLPYLQAVDSPENGETIPNYYSRVEISTEAFRKQVQARWPEADLSGGIESWLSQAVTDEAGSVETLCVGGVTVKIIEDFPFSNVAGYHNMVEGREVKLKGYQAAFYIRARLEEQADANELRMVRQKQYMMALIDKCMTLLRERPADLLGVYNAVIPYTLTNLSFSRIAYLATEAVQLQWDGEVHSLTGELRLNEDNEAELLPDQAALIDLMIDVFYEEVPQEAEPEA